MFLSALCALVERAGARLVGADIVVDLDDLAATDCDVLVVDLDDSDYDVLDTVEVVREELPDLDIVVLTRQCDRARVDALAGAGAGAVIAKTQQPEAVEARVRAALCGERVMDVRAGRRLNDAADR